MEVEGDGEAITWQAIASSKPFRFSVGPQQREFTIHSALVASLSKALSALVSNTDFKEARDGHAVLEAVDERTFISFTQWAYTGDYDCVVKSPAADQNDRDDGSDCEDKGREDSHYGVLRSKKSKMKSKKAAASPAPGRWQDSGYYSPQQRGYGNRLWSQFEAAMRSSGSESFVFHPTRNDDAEVDYTDVFLGHARLYVLADCYGISGLMSLSLYKLGKTLLVFELHDQRLGDVVALLKYAFVEPTPEKLRSLLVLYAACKVEKLWGSVEFQDLLMAHGELSTALIGSLLGRLD